MSFAILFSVLTVMSNTSSSNANTSPLPRNFAGMRTVDAAVPGSQTSNRLWWISNEKQWQAFAKGVSWSDKKQQTAIRVNWKANAIVVVRNVKYVNRIKLNSASIDSKSHVVRLTLRETKTARPISESYHFVAVIVPKSTKSVSDGTKTILVSDSQD